MNRLLQSAFVATGFIVSSAAALAQSASFNPSNGILTLAAVQMGDGAYSNVVVRINSYEVISVGGAVIGIPKVDAENSRLICDYSNRYMNQVNTLFTLKNQTSQPLSRIDIKFTYTAAGLPLPAITEIYYAPIGGVIAANTSVSVQLVPNAFQDFSKAIYPYCGNSANVLTTQITGAYDSNGQKININ